MKRDMKRDMTSYVDCWVSVATALFSQALSGEPQLSESLARPLSAGSFGFAAILSGETAGRFSIQLDGAVLDSPLVGEGVDQREGWRELLREVADAAAGELLAKTGRKCRVESFEAIEGESQISRAFQLQSGDRTWTILICDEVRDQVHDEVRDEVRDVVRDEVRDEVRAPQAAAASEPAAQAPASPQPGIAPGLAPGLELLLDVELDASLRFGCRELPLGDILDLGPGDVVQLDRHVTDPVDLVVGDKIVARGEVVLVNGNFGLRVTEVASPRKRLESIRCLF
jgi:flagellar motor switch protein FliN